MLDGDAGDRYERDSQRGRHGAQDDDHDSWSSSATVPSPHDDYSADDADETKDEQGNGEHQGRPSDCRDQGWQVVAVGVESDGRLWA